MIGDRVVTAAAELARLAERTAAAAAGSLTAIVEGCVETLEGGGTILFAGNGGSAAQCQHLATELVGRFAVADRRPLPALALTTDTSFLTACANDFGFELVFARQVEAVGRPGDALVALSTSGRSANVLRALETARAKGLRTYGLTGADGGDLVERCDVAIAVPDDDPARIQEVHLFLGHLLCEALESGAVEAERR